MDRVRMSNVLRKVFFFAILIPFLNSCGLLFMKGKESKNNLFAWFAGAFGSTGTNNSSAGGAIKLVNSVETINEGQRLEFSISLESYLGKDTEITVNSSNSSLLVNGSTFSKISIPANNLNSTQTLLLEAVEDNNSENETVTIEVTAEGFSSLSFPVTVIDNDTQNILYSALPERVEEGKSANFTIQPAFEPKSEYTMDISSSIPSSLEVSPASITFTKSNYSSPQTIKLTAPEETNTGENFDTNPSGNIVKFNGVSATVLSATSTELIVDIPSGGSTGKITVDTNMGNATSTNDFTFIALTITGRTPDINSNNQLINTPVTITFNSNLDQTTVTSSTFYITQGGILSVDLLVFLLLTKFSLLQVLTGVLEQLIQWSSQPE